ncbi:MAG: flagellar basal body rod C-terminal domain-containing protein [Lawsonibacter sp.]|nr:flagellar basal body rod C-terminal domain-containing protein [Lawsonibacter sp.]
MSSVSTFGTFTTARLGIYASQKALEVVGNNIANINTSGYTRQSLDQSSLYLGGADRYQSGLDVRIGSGALVTGVSQLRDPYLDIRYRNEQSSVGAMDAKSSGLEQLSSILDEVGMGDDGEGVVEAQLNDLIGQMQNLVTQGAGKDAYDTLVRSSASSLVSLFNTYADKLSTLMGNQAESFHQDLDTVNSILTSIRDLNGSIRKSQIHGGDALELKDQRNQLIDKLSQYVRINVTYGQEDLGNGLTVEKLVIKMAGNDAASSTKNATLIDGVYGTQFSIAQVETGKDEDDNPILGDSPNFDLTLSGLTNANNQVLDGSVPLTLSDNDLYGSLQAVRELLTEKGDYASADDLTVDSNAAIKRGIPYYQNALDALANKFATVLNHANTLGDDVIYKTNETGDFLDVDGNITTDSSKYVMKAEYSYYNGGALFSNSGNGDDTAGITASNISIAKSWAGGSVHLLQSKAAQTQEQSTDNSNLAHILYLLTADEDYAPGDLPAGEDSPSAGTPFYTGSFQGMLTNISSVLANDTKTTTAMLENYSSSANELYVDRDAVSGVDLNDEAMGMMQYQKSYSAACRLMTTIDEMLDKLINGTGRAGL